MSNGQRLALLFIALFAVASTALAATSGRLPSNVGTVKPPQIKVVSPDGGEKWTAGSKQTISWEHSGAGAAVNITLEKGGVAVATLVTGLPLNSSGKGEFAWQIANNTKTGDDYRIVVSSVENPAVKGVSASFSIALLSASTSKTLEMQKPTMPLLVPIDIWWPKDGDTWQLGETRRNILWNAPLGSGSGDVVLVKGNTVVRKLAPANYTKGTSSGSPEFTVPTDLIPGDDYHVRVDGPDGKPRSNSVAMKIEYAPPYVSEPKGILRFGSQQVIRWQYIGTLPGLCRVMLMKGNNEYRTLAQAVAWGAGGKGFLNWTVSDTIERGGDYRIRIATADGKVYGESDWLAIKGDDITVKSPQAGAVWKKGGTHMLMWQYDGLGLGSGGWGSTVPKLNIALKTKNGSVDKVFGTIDANHGFAALIMPSDLPARDDYYFELTLNISLVYSSKAESAVFSIE